MPLAGLVKDSLMKTPDVFFILLVFLRFFFTVAWLEVLRPQYLALKWRNISKQWPKGKGKTTIADLQEGFQGSYRQNRLRGGVINLYLLNHLSNQE